MRRRTFLMAACASAAPIEISIKGRPVAALHTDARWDKPFLYPIRTVSGKVLSRGYPVEKLPGEATDHEWHRGIWYGHGIVSGHDFWREQGRDKTSRMVLDGQPKLDGASIAARFAMVTPADKRLGTVGLGFRFQDQGRLRMIDAVVSIHADSGADLVFGDTDDGGFAFRLNDAFREDRGAKLRNSEGLEGTKNIWGQAARWVDYSAVLDGAHCGVAMFDHPSNLRYPTRWHARGYSLNSANPFATRSFSRGRGPDGSHTLPGGGTLALRYRVVVHEGAFEPAAIEDAYREWSRA